MYRGYGFALACACVSMLVFVYVVVMLFTGETFVLVSWPDEDNNVSVISNVRNHISGALVIGEVCHIMCGRNRCPAMVHATGTFTL